MAKKFYDTNILLNHSELLEDLSDVVISTVTISELEDIKTSSHKDSETKFKARKAVRAIRDAVVNNQLLVKPVDNFILAIADKMDYEISNDIKIIASAYGYLNEQYKQNKDFDLTFYTDDILCELTIVALLEEMESLELNCPTLKHEMLSDDTENRDIYKGYKVVQTTDEQLAEVYAQDNCANIFDCIVNEYVIIKDNDDTVCDILKWTGENYVGLNTRPFKSRALGTIKPLDEVQRCVFDSIVTNDITVLFGRSGSGKTTIPLNFIMQSLEKQTYRKCVIVYDFETLRGAKQLGYTPGSLEEKMMTQGAVGNILSSKLGDVSAVERLIASDQLQIVPTANIRGMEIGADTICYVTEAQNLDPYTLKTIIQRCKEGSKIILEGDVLDQRDVDRECGIFRLIDVFKGHKSFGCVKLKNNYRSEIGELADKL